MRKQLMEPEREHVSQKELHMLYVLRDAYNNKPETDRKQEAEELTDAIKSVLKAHGKDWNKFHISQTGEIRSDYY